LQQEVRRVRISPTKIFNCDETGKQVAQIKKRFRIVALKGKRQIEAITSAERSGLITVVSSMNPAGMFVPQLLIFF
jgi:hypothetical protein